ncbi:ABC transporter ATP-binding protein [Exiguobacterium sp. SL14]|nr:ABC transporter ATP-binding protein [Exiguobacterium sp. SL14]MCY1691226.1 ABC transporter ATP-binding protein [Exiguobacterium sp. SL14]
MLALRATNLTKQYGNKTVVDQLNLEIEQGAIFGFLGQNGVGKSTFINMITGLVRPTSGTFELLGATNDSLKDVRTRIGVLPDYSTFYENFTALDHLKYFSKVLGLKTTTDELKQVLREVQLEDAIDMKTKNYSFGMKKKLGIAQALINRPDILFLDEPTSGVDANSILGIHTLIRKIVADGTTIFLTSHNLDEVEKLCTEIAIMQDGSIQTQGTMDELREQHQNNITVHVKHALLDNEMQQHLQSKLSTLAKDVNVSPTQSTFIVQSEQDIATINSYLVSQHIHVYRLEVEEASLEEIFLNLGTESRSA